MGEIISGSRTSLLIKKIKRPAGDMTWPIIPIPLRFIKGRVYGLDYYWSADSLEKTVYIAKT